MVVSCQKRLILFLAIMAVLCVQIPSFAEVRELSDAEMDEIAASNLPENITDLITNQLGEQDFLSDPLALLNTLITSEFLESLGLVHVNASNSQVFVQTNIYFVLSPASADVFQSNTYSNK